MNGTIDKIRKRSGVVVDFDRTKIERAIGKSCAATRTDVAEDSIARITDGVIARLTERFRETIPGVEDIQDLVEQGIVEAGLFAVARAYILYREEHTKLRAERSKELVELAKRHVLTVRKKDGRSVPFDVSEITEAIVACTSGVKGEVSVDAVVRDALTNIAEGMSTREIDQAVLLALRGRIEEDPAYSVVAARYLLNVLYRDLLGVRAGDRSFTAAYRARFADSLQRGVEAGRLDARLLSFDLPRLAAALTPGRDTLFDYLGIQTLYDRYLLRNSVEKILEVPQYMWMRIAVGLALEEREKEARALDFYAVMSQLRYVPSTPTLFHSGTVHPQMSSCYLTTVEDNLSHIFKCIGDNAQLAKWSGGLGNDWTNIRATGARVASTNVGSQGVVPFLKVADMTAAAINRSGKRRGATCAYLETWHYDIEDFLELRKNTGDERRRTHDMNTANWIPDLFLERVGSDGLWTLFSPDEVPDLHHRYGREFARAYEAYEGKAARGELRLARTVRARDLWRKMLTMLFETGHPWMTFKDPCNIRSPQDHVGVVKSSNLCTEITLNTSREETAVCNLGSLNIVRHVRDGALDWALLRETTRTAIRMLDNVIDLNFYPTPEAKQSNLRHRPVGLGVMGFQDALYELGLRFDTEAAVDLSDRLLEEVSAGAIAASADLAAERGVYETFRGSKWERGLLPLDTLTLLEEERRRPTGVPKTTRLDWVPIRAKARAGMRNSNVLALAPTATISNIAGCYPSIEPIYKNLYVKSNASGEFTKSNPYLIRDLKRRRLWTETVREEIKRADGSLEHCPSIPHDLRERYREVFDMDPLWVLRHAAVRGKWIDQSQSVNLFVRTTSGKVIASLYETAWRLGLKTTYYLRTLAASAVEKSTLDVPAKLDAVSRAEASARAPAPSLIAPPSRPAEGPAPTPVAAPAPARTVYRAEDASCEGCQ